MGTKTLAILAVVAVVLGLALIGMSGCKAVNANTPEQALPPGALNSFDAATYESLSAVHASVVSLQSQIAAGTFVPSPTEKAALNDVIAALNAADITYVAYHTGTATEAQMQAQLDAVNSANASLQTTVTGGK